MAFSYTILNEIKQAEVVGATKMVFGTYTSNSGSTGGDIKTGLKRVDFISLQPKGSSVVANQPAVNETLPLQSGDVTIVTTADEVGSFIAFGA